MQATMTITVAMDEAGNVASDLSLDGTLSAGAHGLMYAAAVAQLKHAFGNDAEQYAQTARPAELAAFVAAAHEPLPEPAVANATMDWRVR